MDVLELNPLQFVAGNANHGGGPPGVGILFSRAIIIWWDFSDLVEAVLRFLLRRDLSCRSCAAFCSRVCRRSPAFSVERHARAACCEFA